MKYFRGIISLLLFGFLVSCDAPKLNPLDPQNPDYHLVAIDGFVKNLAGAHQPISGVNVLWKNQNIVLETDASGYFKIDQLLPQSGTIVFEKEGYSTKDSLISFENQKTLHLEILLNAIPKSVELAIYTSVLNRYPDVQYDSLFIKAKVSDAENEIDSVFVRCTELNINKALELNPSSGYYENKFSPGDLKLNFLDEGIGKNFEIIVRDRSNKSFIVDSSTIKRVIRKDIIFRSPANLEIVTNPTKFIWERFLPGFNFKYMIEIYKKSVSPPVLVKQWPDIPKGDIEFTSAIVLPRGEYFWVIWTIDEFNNRARSREASFVVQ